MLLPHFLVGFIWHLADLIFKETIKKGRLDKKKYGRNLRWLKIRPCWIFNAPLHEKRQTINNARNLCWQILHDACY